MVLTFTGRDHGSSGVGWLPWLAHAPCCLAAHATFQAEALCALAVHGIHLGVAHDGDVSPHRAVYVYM